MQETSNTIDSILDRWRSEMASADFVRTKVAGDAFEQLCIAYLTHDPVQCLQYRNIKRYGDWAKEHSFEATDTGIDLVAELVNGKGFAAIQCKFHAEGKSIAKAEIDSFLAASGTDDFQHRVLIDTTGRDWSGNVESTLRKQAIPVVRLGLHNLRESLIDWARFVECNEVVSAERLQLRPHQLEAVEKIADGLGTSGSRGKVIMACGTGKTLVSLRAAEQLVGVGGGGGALYLVPSLALMSQTVRVWAEQAELPLRAFAVCSDNQVGKRRKNQGDHIDMDALDLAWPATTDAAILAEKAALDDPVAMTVIFATYQSSPVIEQAQREHGLPAFNLMVCDEAHRTAGAILDGEKPSNFTRIHRDGNIAVRRRLYMTATPKVYAESARTKAGDLAASLCSMDDETLYGPVLYELGFAAAVEEDLLSDYRVVVLTIPESQAARVLTYYGGALDEGLNIDSTALMIGCWRALAKADPEAFSEKERAPMRRAIAFCKTIATSKQVERLFDDISTKYRTLSSKTESGNSLPVHAAPARHIDGTFNASRRAEALVWLDDPGENECRILTNARCLTEGVDLPALDGILFMHPRKSQIEVVQTVGRVMRKAKGKQMGYIILPVVIAPGSVPENVLDDNERWRKVWQILNAIRSHDEGFDAELNRIEMGEKPRHLSIVPLADWAPETEHAKGPEIGWGEALDPEEPTLAKGVEGAGASLFDGLPGAIMAKVVEKCGSRRYWEEWAGDVAKIGRAHVERITALVTVDEQSPENKDVEAAAEIFDGFVSELRDDLNPGVTKEDAIEMLAQHLVTGPVFDALFGWGGGGRVFTLQNPVSRAMQTILDVIKPTGIEAEAASLDEFYDSVRRRVKGAETDKAKQQIVVDLYDKFFRNAFADTSKKLGIVYTPVEIADFILHSVAMILKNEFSTGLSDRGVHILDPFAGTGTFIVRLLQSGLIGQADLERKYASEIHANEIVLLAYYIASVNIETAFHGIAGGFYRPFTRICLADTFQLNESDELFAELLKANSDRQIHQKTQDIRVIIGNPPWMAGKKGSGYPQLYERIGETYVNRSTATLKNSLYDSYKMAIRWASDRIGEKGVVGFVTNGSWIDGNADSGVRACLAEEFTSIHVVNLRGNQRTQGERSRREGGKVFGQGSRAPVAVMILAKDPDAAHDGCRILYRDIGHYLSREDKLALLRDWGSIADIDDWEEIVPDRHHDWIDKRDEAFQRLYPLGSKSAKARKTDEAIFELYSRGYATSRDAYIYNFSREACAENARGVVDDYRGAVAMRTEHPEYTVDGVASRFSSHVRWDRELKNNLRRGKAALYSRDNVWRTHYRPFVKQHCYVDYVLVNNKYQQDSIFPTDDAENRAICVPGVGSTTPFSVLVVDTMPDLAFNSAGQCFPRYRYERGSDWPSLPGVKPGPDRIDNISDTALRAFHLQYSDSAISKDAIFDYVYGILHAPAFHERFGNDLAKELPRIPFAADFHAFSKAGRRLAGLHLGYETGPKYPLSVVFQMEGEPKSEHFGISSRKMRFTDDDKTILAINDHVHLTGIPPEAHEYQVNGRTPLEWFIDRYRIVRDKESGIVNDPNGWFADPRDLISAFRRVVHLSVETVKIVSGLPPALND